MDGYAQVPANVPSPGKVGTLGPHHAFQSHAPIPAQGDPFNTRNIVHYGDEYMMGKPRHDPGHHINLYESIAALQATMEPFWGFVATKLLYRRQPNRLVHGYGPGFMAADVNIDVPEPSTYGDFATYTARQARVHV